MEIKRKLRQSGSSLIVTVPREVVDEYGLSIGDDIVFKTDQEGDFSIKRPEISAVVDEAFLESIGKIVEEHKDTIMDLSKR